MPPIPQITGKTQLSFFDQDNADINLFNLVDDELIRIAGSELLYYKFLRDATKYEIFEVQEDSFQLYGVYHIVCAAKLLRDEEIVVDEILTNKTENVGGLLDLDV